MTTELVSPAGIFAHEDTALASRPGVSDKTVVGLFSNGKANAHLFMENLQAMLAQRHDGIEFVHFRKQASRPAKFTDDFLNRCHVAAAAFGD
jgi:hypothetical protein